MLITPNFPMLRLCQIGRKYSYFLSKLCAICDYRMERANVQLLQETKHFRESPTKAIAPIRSIQAGPCKVRQRTRPKKCDPKVGAKDKDNNCPKKEEKKKEEKKKEKPKPNKCSDDKDKKKDKKPPAEKKKNENPCHGKSNLVAVLYKQHDIRVEEREKPTLCPGEVLVAMDCVALSSSDVSYFAKGELISPIILGRDGTGTVAQISQGVRKLKEGDRVVIEPNIPCHQCEMCKACQYHLCGQMRSNGIIPYDGIMACYHAHEADYCHKLPDCVTMEEGTLMGMLANGINVCSRCPLCIGSSLLVVGAGPVGIISLIAAKAMGATNTCIMCKFKDRLELAKQFGAKTILICEGATPEDMAQIVREELGCAPGITVDSVGSDISLKLAIASTASGGAIVLSGVASGGEPTISLTEIAQRDLSLRSALKHSYKYPAAIALAGSGAINLKPLISHHHFFEEVSNAFSTVLDNQDTVNKVILHIRPRDRNNKQPF